MEMMLTSREDSKKNISLTNKCYFGYLKNKMKKIDKCEDKDEIKKYIKTKWSGK